MSPRAVQAGPDPAGADPAVLRYAAASNEVSWNGLAPGPSSSASSWSSGVELDAGIAVDSIVDACRIPGVEPEPVVERARAEVGGDTVVDTRVVVESIVDHARRLPGVAPEPVVEHARAEVGGDIVVDAGVVVESIVDHARRLPGVAVDPALVAPSSRASRDHERALRALRMARARRLAFASIAAVTRAP
jgi:hypothetical protein